MTTSEVKQAVLDKARTATPAPVLVEAVVRSTQQPPAMVRTAVRKMVLSGELVLTDDRKVQAKAG
jgi:hypothetical protein